MDKPTQQSQQFVNNIPFLGRNDFQVVSVKPGYSLTKIGFDQNKNHFGAMYAGAIYTLAESSGGIVFFSIFDSEKYFPIVYKQEIKYIAPAKSQIFLEYTISPEEQQRIQKEMETKGKSNFILNAEIKDNKGKIVAKAIGYYQGRSASAKL